MSLNSRAHGSNCHCSPRVAEDHGIKADAEGLQICCKLVQAIAQPHRRLTIAARKPYSLSADPSAGLCRNNTAENSNDTAFCKLWMILTVLHMVAYNEDRAHLVLAITCCPFHSSQRPQSCCAFCMMRSSQQRWRHRPGKLQSPLLLEAGESLSLTRQHRATPLPRICTYHITQHQQRQTMPKTIRPLIPFMPMILAEKAPPMILYRTTSRQSVFTA